MKVNPLNYNFFTEPQPKKGSGQDFMQTLLEKIKQVDSKEKEAEKALSDLISGEEVDPVELSMKLAEADLNMKILLRIRNKALEAYQEIMRMQI